MCVTYFREFERLRERSIQIADYFMKIMLDLWIPVFLVETPTLDQSPGGRTKVKKKKTKESKI
jgi:hypothetical protein